MLTPPAKYILLCDTCLIISLVFFKYLILQIVQDRRFFCYEEVQNKAESDSKETVLAGILKLNTIMAYTSGTI